MCVHRPRSTASRTPSPRSNEQQSIEPKIDKQAGRQDEICATGLTEPLALQETDVTYPEPRMSVVLDNKIVFRCACKHSLVESNTTT
eukprot:COSAG06_NODE_19358_length_842_cov_0.970390_1_plen_86_part_10